MRWDAAWVGSIATLLLVLVTGALGYFTIGAGRYGRPRRRLLWMTVSDEPLVSQSSYVDPEDLDVTYKSQPVKHPRLVQIELSNIGKSTLRDSDYPDDANDWPTIVAKGDCEIVAPTLLLVPRGGWQ